VLGLFIGAKHEQLCHKKVFLKAFCTYILLFEIFWQENIDTKTARKMLVKLIVGF
jgi:hypothetical protein